MRIGGKDTRNEGIKERRQTRDEEEEKKRNGRD